MNTLIHAIRIGLLRSVAVTVLSAPLVVSVHAEGAANAYLGDTVTVSQQNQGNLPSIIERFNKQGGTIILDPSVKKGPMPVRPNHNTRIVDLRYSGGVNMVRGNHPRLEGIWPQYSNLNTGLGRNFIVTDVLPYDAKVETWKGEPIAPNPANKNRAQDSQEYSNTHNHYQNLLSEVWAFSPTVNAVALWGDSGSFYPGAKSWGGFLSARSWPVHWQEYVPEGTPGFDDKDFDAQLVGLEVDVLNGGLDHGAISKKIGMPLSKSGIQIVGFGKRNTAAIEIRSEDTDDIGKKPDERRGTWHYGIIAYNSLNTDSTFLLSATPAGKTGADFSMTDYSDSALKIKSNGPKTGISFNKYQGGELYSESDRLVARMGKQGLSVVSADGDEVVRIDNSGVIRWAGVKLAYVPYYIIPVFMLIVLLATVVVAYRMSREIKDMRALLARHGVTPPV
jgi:hypothetical protein